MALLILTMMTANPVIASVDDDEEEYESQCVILDREHYDPVNCEYDIDECAEMFNPRYDQEGFDTCNGRYWPSIK